jgi:5-methylcytosine-specific restriction endonuclease McrA
MDRLKTEKWMVIKVKIVNRDGYKCRKCGATMRIIDGQVEIPELSVHHIVPFKKSRNDSLENLVLLCSSCHKKVENQFTRVGVTNYLRRWIEENKANVVIQ